MHAYRTHTCGQLRTDDVGKSVRLSGWVHRKRDHGGLLFVDLRDHYGLTQCVVTPESPHFSRLERIRVESVVTLTGVVVARDAAVRNPNLLTGDIELKVTGLDVQSEAEELPLPVFGEPDYPEDIRLKYRFLDLRRDRLHAHIVLRSAVISSLRRRMIDQGFQEFQTPILTASSPEGARDFLVPSRLHPGKFYALPQAPQQFKQLLMVAGFDRYFQIAPCFRDEDARADRSPGEFYQLDFEMSFVTQEDVFAAIEPVLHGVFEEFANGRAVSPAPFERIRYADAIRQYGSDKPDLRNPIRMGDVSDAFRDSGFKVFAAMLAADPGVEIWAIPAPGGGSRAFCDKMNGWAQSQGQPGLGYIFWREGEEGGAGPIAKNIGPERSKIVADAFGLGTGDAIFFVAGKPSAMYKFAGEARNRIGRDLGLVDENQFRFCWIVDFPMYEWNEDEKKIDFSHNPFSMPNYDHEAFLGLSAADRDTIERITAFQYDIVCNGVELSSGAIRNHKPEIMLKAFELAGYGRETVEEKFGGMLNAFRYGAPPHGGSAPGVDRIVMLLADVSNLREVIAFPLNQQAQDLMMGAPSEVTARQLRELSIRTIAAEKR
jgi:aspartyl-tRNA synthetase